MDFLSVTYNTHDWELNMILQSEEDAGNLKSMFLLLITKS